MGQGQEGRQEEVLNPRWVATLAAPRRLRYRRVEAAVVIAVWAGAGATVSGLLFRCGPSAVAGLVVPVHVDAVQTAPGWPLAHVRQEVFESLPSVTDANAAQSVAGVANASASAQHTAPCLVGRRLAHAVRAHRGVALQELFSKDAAATLSQPLSKARAARDLRAAAVASAFEEGAALAIRTLPAWFRDAHDRQPAEPRAYGHRKELSLEWHS